MTESLDDMEYVSGVGMRRVEPGQGQQPAAQVQPSEPGDDRPRHVAVPASTWLTVVTVGVGVVAVAAFYRAGAASHAAPSGAPASAAVSVAAASVPLPSGLASTLGGVPPSTAREQRPAVPTTVTRTGTVTATLRATRTRRVYLAGPTSTVLARVTVTAVRVTSVPPVTRTVTATRTVRVTRTVRR